MIAYLFEMRGIQLEKNDGDKWNLKQINQKHGKSTNATVRKD